MGIKSGIPFMMDIPIDEDFDYALSYYEAELKDTLYDHVTPEQWKMLDDLIIATVDLKRRRKIIKDFKRVLLRKYYNELLNWAKRQLSRYAFQALGTFLMEHSVEIRNDVKKLILDNSHWKDEFRKLGNVKYRIKRKMFLFKFRVKILAYS